MIWSIGSIFGAPADPAAGGADGPMGVVPVLIGPLQALVAVLPGLLAALGAALGGLFLTLFRWSTVKKIPKVLWKARAGVAVLALIVAVLSVEGWQWRLVLPGLAGLIAYGALWPMAKGRTTARRAWLRHLDIPVGLALVGGAFLLGANHLGSSHAAAPTGPASAQDAPWPMFRGGPARRGAVPNAAEPISGGVIWSYTEDCRMFYSSPCIVGNRLYIAGTDYGPMRDRGAIYCLDADTGSLLWKSRPRRYLATFSSPSVAGKYLVCGEGLHYTTNARIICLDVERQGAILWTLETRSHVESSPAIDLENKRVFIGAGDDGYRCLALDPDAAGRPKVLWHKQRDEGYQDAETSPVVYEGKVYVGLGIGGNALVCLDGATGKEEWRIVTPYPEFGSPTVQDGRLYFGMGNGNFIETAEQVMQKELGKLREAGASEAEIAAARERLKAGGAVWCVDLKKAADLARDPAKAKDLQGAVLWTYQVPKVVLSAVAAGEGRLYFGCQDGKLYSITTDGQPVAQWDSHSGILASPAVGTNYVYVVTTNGWLFGLDAQTLRPVWETRAGVTGQFISSPALARGHIYVGTENEGVVCLGEPRFRDPLWVGRSGGPGAGGCADGSPVAELGRYVWQWPTMDATDTPPATPLVTTPVAPLGEALYVAQNGPDRVGLARLNLPGTAGTRVTRPTEAWFVPTAQPVSDVAALGNSIFAVVGSRGQSGRALKCFVAGDAWEGSREELEAKVQAAIAVLHLSLDRNQVITRLADGGALRLDGAGAALYLGRGETMLAKLAGATTVSMPGLGFAASPAGGTERWQRPVDTAAGGRLLATQDELFVTDRADGLACLDVRGAEAGHERWSAAKVGRVVGSPLLVGDRVYVAVEGGSPGSLVALDRQTGAEQWRAPLNGAPVTGPVENQGVLCVGLTEYVTALSVVGGVRLWSVPITGLGPDLVTDADRIVAATAAGELFILDWANGRVVKRLTGAQPGLAPLLAGDVMLYVDQGSVQRYDLSRGVAKRFADIAWMLPATAPMVQVKSQVFLPTAKRGLIGLALQTR
jgi:outer membrane protein assembly factor BamB